MACAPRLIVRFHILLGLFIVWSAPGCAQGSGEEGQAQSKEDAGGGSAPDAQTSAADAFMSPPSKADVVFGSDGRRLPEATFVGAENSVLDEALGSVSEQLSAGLRYLRMPIHDNDFRARDDYGLGFSEPRDRLNLGGNNPNRENLGDWLDEVVHWSDAHPGHAPITLVIDLLDDLTDNDNYDEGDLHRLNAVLKEAFGERLFTPEQVEDGQWPTVDALRGQVMVVFGGHEATRTSYREARGQAPTIAADTSGTLMLVHEEAFKLRYWMGRRSGTTVEWSRSGGVPALLRHPALAMNDEGLLVLVGTSSPAQDIPAIYLMVGESLRDGGVFWRDAEVLYTGSSAVVRFPDRSQSTVEVLVDASTPNARMLELAVRRNDGSVTMLKSEETEATAWDRDIVRSEGEMFVRVFADQGGVLRYETELRRRPIAPEQLAFLEYVKGDHATLQRWFRYSEDLAEIESWVAQRLVVRAPYSEEVTALEQLPAIMVSPDPYIDALAPYRELPESSDSSK